MIISMLYKVARRLLSVPGVLLRRDTDKEAELLVLRRENAVLQDVEETHVAAVLPWCSGEREVQKVQGLCTRRS
ncbi:hypothetical protein ABZV41_21180 [Streptomyces sp. NPDC005098]|uniref:hypothetical protein n=1 Tax=Streptomyces sp. NPDC005098 TaxID=3154560 RepID=UPI0033A54A3C